MTGKYISAAWLALAAIILCFCSALPVRAQLLGGPPPAQLQLEFAQDPDGDPLGVARLIPDQGWYAYANDSGDSGMPTELSARLLPPNGEEKSGLAVAYPPGEEKPDPVEPSLTARVYDGSTPLFITLPQNANAGDALSVTLHVLMCSAKSCQPGRLTASAELPPTAALKPAQEHPWWPTYLLALQETVQPAPEAEPAQAPTTSGARLELEPRYFQESLEVSGLVEAILLALLAGFILNFMPCVLPVIGLKLGTFVTACGLENDQERQRSFRTHNLFFSLGVVLYFLFLAGVFSLLGMAWGQIFQQPKVVMLLACFVFALALSLMGLYHLPIVDVASVPGEDRRPRVSAFVTGLLATLLATPCSGPLLGGVLAFALTGPPLVVATVLSSVGLGMAAPYLLLAAKPGLVRFMPRPGAWNVHLERFVGLVLAGTCIYLLSVLPKAFQLRALILMWLIALVAWAVPLFGGLKHSDLRRTLARLAGAAVLALAIWFAMQPLAKSVQWTTYSEDYLQANLGKKRLLVDFTADWCVSCKFLERTTFRPGNLATWARDYDLHYVQVDLTGDNPEGQRLLAALGAQSIPTVALFPAGDGANTPLVLRDLFTSSAMDQALLRMFDGK